MIMIVKPLKEMSVSIEYVDLIGQSIGEKKSGFLSVQKMRTKVEEVEVDQESGGSSTEEVEAESPKSVGKFGRMMLGGFLHNQVLRVKQEELVLREDIDADRKKSEEELVLREDIDADRKKSDCGQERHVNVVILRRPILPCSPLSGKNSCTRSFKAASR